MLLTRAPLNDTRIATHTVPCDLHVLNTPPAFVLSQNQTLRKKLMVAVVPLPALLHPLNLGGTYFESRVSARLQRRAAHNSIFFLFPACLASDSLPPCDFHPALPARRRAGPHCQRTSFEGTKKPIGCLRTSIDIPSLGRPRVVAAREASAPHPTPRQLILPTFFTYFSPPHTNPCFPRGI